MHATCPNNPNHTEFYTTAHVMQSWKVDANGLFICSIDECLETTQGPNPGNLWECADCGATATVESTS